MERVCKQCGKVLSAEAKYCDGCGSPSEVKLSVKQKNIILLSGAVVIICLFLAFFFSDESRIIENDGVTSGAVYDLQLDEGKKIVESAIKDCCGVSLKLDKDFRINEIEKQGGISYIFVNEDHFSFPLGIEIFVYDEYVQAVVIKADTSNFNFDGLGIIQELYCCVANEVTGDDISVEQIQELVKSGESAVDQYRNDSIHLICRTDENDAFIYYYMFYACSEDFYMERSE